MARQSGVRKNAPEIMETAKSAPFPRARHFRDDAAAREYLESMRWPDGPVCPHCGVNGNHYKLRGTAHRKGLYKCSESKCRKQFSVTVGTAFERSHIPVSKWLAAAYLICSSKRGISAIQLHRDLGITYKTAWFLAHRIRLAMSERGVRQDGLGRWRTRGRRDLHSGTVLGSRLSD
jgi:transposase-like protein